MMWHKTLVEMTAQPGGMLVALLTGMTILMALKSIRISPRHTRAVAFSYCSDPRPRPLMVLRDVEETRPDLCCFFPLGFSGFDYFPCVCICG